MSTQAHDFTWDGRALTGYDSEGVLWTVDADTQGWLDGVGVRSARQARSQQDGEWDATPNREARTVVLGGLAMAATTRALEGAARRHAASSKRGELSGSSEWGTLSGVGVLDDKPRFTAVSDSKARWQLTVTLPDPLLYGPAMFATASLAASSGGTGLIYPLAYPLDYGVAPGVSPGAVILANEGTASYWPRLRIDGPVTNPVVTLTESGAWVRYGGTVAAGQWLDIDTANRRVLLNGQVPHRHKVTSYGDWLALPVGGGSLSWTADDADPDALLSVWSYQGAWL